MNKYTAPEVTFSELVTETEICTSTAIDNEDGTDFGA